MNIVIESPGFKASNDLENFVKEKIGKLESHSHGIVRANVTLYSGPSSDPAGCHCEIRLEVPGNDHFVKKNAESFEQAIAATVETLEKAIQKTKDKQISRRHSGDGQGEPFESTDTDLFEEE